MKLKSVKAWLLRIAGVARRCIIFATGNKIEIWHVYRHGCYRLCFTKIIYSPSVPTFGQKLIDYNSDGLEIELQLVNDDVIRASIHFYIDSRQYLIEVSEKLFDGHDIDGIIVKHKYLGWTAEHIDDVATIKRLLAKDQ